MGVDYLLWWQHLDREPADFTHIHARKVSVDAVVLGGCQSSGIFASLIEGFA